MLVEFGHSYAECGEIRLNLVESGTRWPMLVEVAPNWAKVGRGNDRVRPNVVQIRLRTGDLGRCEPRIWEEFRTRSPGEKWRES